MTGRVRDRYTIQEFEELLEEADANAKSDREMDFVAEMSERFDEWGLEAYLSDAQDEWLRRLAGIG